MKISIIVCSYNVEKWLCRCIDSLLMQTYKNWELWIINDGSTDSTANIVTDYAMQDSRIHLHSQENQGLSSARKSGIRCATGEYLTFVDADDYVGEQYIEHLLETLHSYPEAECIQGGHLRYEDGNVTKVSVSKKVQYPPLEAIVLHKPPLWAKLWKTSFLKQHIEHIPEHMNMAEDWVTDFQLFPHLENVYFTPYADYHYVIHGQNMSYARYTVEEYAQIVTAIINAINQDFWRKSKYAFQTQFDFLSIIFKQLANSSLSPQQCIGLLQQLPTPLLSRDFFSHSLGYNTFFITWLLKHKYYKILLAIIKIRFK